MDLLVRGWFVIALAGCAACGRGCGNDPDRPAAVESEGQRFLLCGRIADDGSEETIEAGTTRLVRKGVVVERQGEGDGVARLGVIAGVEEWNEPNRANLQALLAWFTREQAEAVILAGGVGPDRETCLNVLQELAGSGLVIMPLIGASADFQQYRQAVAQARRAHANIVDLTTARLVRWDGVDLVTLPGYHNPFYLHHRRGGCAYQERDVEALAELVAEARQPVMLVAAAPPRGSTAHAIDLARGGVNIGDPALTRMISERRVPFGVFGHVYEAGGRATSDVAGRAPVPEGRWSKSLYLNPGAAEAVPYDLQGGGHSRGMGALIEVGAEGARFRLFKVDAGPAEG
jgi:hypothetical protein